MLQVRRIVLLAVTTLTFLLSFSTALFSQCGVERWSVGDEVLTHPLPLAELSRFNESYW